MNRGAEARRNRRLQDWLDTFFDVERNQFKFGGDDLREVTAWIEDIRAINSAGINLERCADLPAPLALKILDTRSVLCYREDTTPTKENTMPAATAAVAPAKGVRQIKTSAKVVTAKQKALAKKYYEENLEANKFRTQADKTRKELFGDMANAGIEGFLANVTIAGSPLTLDVKIDTPTKMVVDCAKLKELVSEKQFMEIISASQKSVEDTVGKIIATRTLVPKDGETNVTVKLVK